MKTRSVTGSVTLAQSEDNVQTQDALVGKRGDRRRRWGVVLAGGDGFRLRALTRFICGDDRPKQFCPLLGEGTLLEQTRRRAEQTIPPEQILFAVTRAHQEYYLGDLGDRPIQRIVQPCNKGTAPAILYSLLHIARMEPDGLVAILPSDHSYSPEASFTATLESAFEIAQARPQSVVLLGARPKAPEVEYGWIELGGAAGDSHADIFHVTGFHEKPSLRLAERLLRSGALWNTFVMVGHVRTFLELAREFAPRLVEAFESEPVLPPLGAEVRIVDQLYDRIAPTDFSRQILSPGANRLVTLPLGGVEWNDLGDPERVLSTLLAIDADLPRWARRWRAAMGEEGTSAQCLAALA